MKRLFLTLIAGCLVILSFAQNSNLRRTVEQGIRRSIELTQNANYQDAFAKCREVQALVIADSQNSNDPHYDLHYLIAKERLRMYNRIRRSDASKQQLDLMESYAKQSKVDTLMTDLLFAKAQYYQVFGQSAQSMENYRQWFSRKAAGQDVETTDKSYQDIVSQAKKDGNTALANSMQTLYNNWKDSIQAAKNAEALNLLKQQYADSQQSLKEKESKISTNKILIGILGFIAVALAVAVVVLVLSLLRFLLKNKSLKRSLNLANENNEQKSQFITHLSEQTEPVLADIDQHNSNPVVKKDVTALRSLFNDVQTYVQLEESREELYPHKELNISDFCERVMEEAKANFQPEVEAVVKAPRVFIKANEEALQQILSHLLLNAGVFTESGKITLEFKKRSAHTGQFIVTDTGCGIAPEIRQDLFKPFKPIEDLREGDKLGLPICSLIAYKLNGELHLDDEYKRGTRFILELHER